MGIPTFFILVLFLKFFQFFSFFSSFFTFSLKKTPVALAGRAFACLFFARPLPITSGLLGHGVPKSIKNYPQFLVFGVCND
jgi:hypothetical protein